MADSDPGAEVFDTPVNFNLYAHPDFDLDAVMADAATRSAGAHVSPGGETAATPAEPTPEPEPVDPAPTPDPNPEPDADPSADYSKEN